MNAQTVFPENMFCRLRQDVQAKKVFNRQTTPYKKDLKIKSNRYTLQITTGHYSVGDRAYFVHFSEDHRIPNNIGGSGGTNVDLSSYEAFCKQINRILSKFPDYTAPIQPKPMDTQPIVAWEQLSLF